MQAELLSASYPQWGWKGPGISYPNDLGQDMGEFIRKVIKYSLILIHIAFLLDYTL